MYKANILQGYFTKQCNRVPAQLYERLNYQGFAINAFDYLERNLFKKV